MRRPRALAHTHTTKDTHRRPHTHIMSCADGELCKLLDVALGPTEGHGCRGGCGGCMYGICGEVEDPDDGNTMYRICHSRATKKRRRLPHPSRIHPSAKRWGVAFQHQARGRNQHPRQLQEGPGLAVLQPLKGFSGDAVNSGSKISCHYEPLNRDPTVSLTVSRQLFCLLPCTT